MKIIDFTRCNEPLDSNSEIVILKEVLIVEMTQEEYQIACHAIIEAQKQKNK